MPPNLDLPRSSRPVAANLRMEKMLELFFGMACTLDPDGSIRIVSENWDDLMSRTGRTDLLRDPVLGKPFLDLLPNDDVLRTSFCFALASLAEGKQKQLLQSADYGSAAKPFTVNYVFHALREDDKLTGYLVQGLDATHETVIRMALLDRERKLREIKSSYERQSEEISSLKKTLDGRISGHDQTVWVLLHAFQHDPQIFSGELCRLAVEASDAMFATLAIFSPSRNCFHFTAHHNAPGFHRLVMDADALELTSGEGPSGIAVQNGCATKFDHLLEREDFTKWRPLAEQNGYNCIWVLPLEDQDGLYGALQLYFPEPDKLLTVDQYSALSVLCQTAVPMLRVSDAWNSHSETTTQAASHEAKPEGFRVLAAGLSEEFSNLLTGVLGHSSLAVAEIGDSHAALNDIHAIERAARDAARLTRRLSAICGSARRGSSPVDLCHFVQHYAERDRANYFPDGPAGVSLSMSTCPVRADVTTLEVMLDGMAEHARTVMSGSTPEWTLTSDGNAAQLTLTYSGTASQPTGWNEGGAPAHSHNQVSEMFFAREAARNLGGDLSLNENGSTASITLNMPLVKAVVPA